MTKTALAVSYGKLKTESDALAKAKQAELDKATDELRKVKEAMALTADRLRSCRLEARELRQVEDELRLSLLQVTNKESSLERVLQDLSAEMAFDM